MLPLTHRLQPFSYLQQRMAGNYPDTPAALLGIKKFFKHLTVVDFGTAVQPVAADQSVFR